VRPYLEGKGRAVVEVRGRPGQVHAGELGKAKGSTSDPL